MQTPVFWQILSICIQKNPLFLRKTVFLFPVACLTGPKYMSRYLENTLPCTRDSEPYDQFWCYWQSSLYSLHCRQMMEWFSHMTHIMSHGFHTCDSLEHMTCLISYYWLRLLPKWLIGVSSAFYTMTYYESWVFDD